MIGLLLFQILLLGISGSLGQDCGCEPCKYIPNGPNSGGYTLLETNSSSCPLDPNTGNGCLYFHDENEDQKCFCDPGDTQYDVCGSGAGSGYSPYYSPFDLLVVDPSDTCEACVGKCQTVACPVTRDTQVANLPKLGKAFYISFSLIINEYSTDTYASLIHFTIGGPASPYGSRIPAVWVKSDGKLHINFDIDGKTIQYVDTLKQYPLNDAIQIDLSQKLVNQHWRYMARVNGEIITSQINTDPRQFFDVNVYLSAPWTTAAKASVTDLVINPTCSSPGTC